MAPLSMPLLRYLRLPRSGRNIVSSSEPRWCHPRQIRVTSSQPAAQESTAAQARRQLLEGKTQLQQYKLYAALPLLQDALKLYTQAGDQNGIGAASDALGDLYEREGQYATARNYFARARDAFNARKEVVNTNLELGKLAETYLLTGDFSTARTLLTSFDKKRGPGDRHGWSATRSAGSA